MYVAYSSAGILYVQSLYGDYNFEGRAMKIGEGLCLDIVETNWGFSTLIRIGKNCLHLRGHFEDGKQKFSTIIMDNGEVEVPKKRKAS